jgi:hypothetical protein
MECILCKNTFNSKSSLKHHQKTARYCLKIQGVKSKEYICMTCDKTFSNKYNLSVHYQTCSNYKAYHISNQYKEEISHLHEKIAQKEKTIQDQKNVYENQKTIYEKNIKELQDKLENVAIKAISRPTTRNTHINNYINQLKPVTKEHLLDSVSNLTIDHIIKGPEGYAEYALEYPLKDRMLCSDYSRRKVKFKDNDGNVITDPEMTTLVVKFFDSIKDKNRELIRKYANEAKEKLGDDNVMDTVVKLFDYKADVEKASNGGEKTDFHHDFVRQMCSHTLKD